MTKGNIAKLLNIDPSRFVIYRQTGVIPCLPLCYFTMDADHLACYVRICKKLIKNFKEKRIENHRETMKVWHEKRKGGIARSWRLPDWTESARGTERECYLDEEE